MKKGIIKKLSHDEDFMYFQIKPDVQVVYILDKISSSLDKYKEGLAYPEKNIDYKKFVPRRATFNIGDGTIYAIIIYNKDLIDLILFKNNSIFNKFMKSMKKNFIWADGSKF